MVRSVAWHVTLMACVLTASPANASAQSTAGTTNECTAGDELSATAPMSFPRGSHVALRLSDGRVLLAGSDDRLRHAEIFDPISGTLSPTGWLNDERCYGCGSALLADGRVLVFGGWTGTQTLYSSEIYDPAVGQFARLPQGDLHYNRLGPNTHLLNNGQVLAFGGHGFGIYSTAELFTPGPDSWSLTGGMAAARLGASVKLADGRVLVVGGLTSGGAYLATAEVYDPASGLFTPTGPMTEGRHGHSAVVLPTGRVLVTGGMAVSQQHGFEVLASAEVYDPATGSFLPVGPMATARTSHASFLLPDGRALIAGGTGNSGQPLATTEVFDPVTQIFSPGPLLIAGRSSPGVTILDDGRILISGGYGTNGGRLNTMEIVASCTEDLSALDALYETDEDAAVVVPGRSTGSGATPLFRVATQPRHGRLEGAGPNWQYLPEPDFHGTDSFTYVVEAGGRTSAPATITIVVRSVNDAPVLIAGGPYYVWRGVSLNVAATATDVDDASVLLEWDLDGDGTFEMQQAALQ